MRTSRQEREWSRQRRTQHGRPAESDAGANQRTYDVVQHNVGTQQVLDVEALNYGWTTRFISHACDPNTAFAEMENRTNVKVLIKMIKNVKPGAQITVNYGPERWFKSTCDACWLDQEQEQRS
ncbi:SET domain [Phytophthora cactorum]|nr:SET domain [Phytophthora cactorum]